METPIATSLRETHTRPWITLIVATIILAGDFVTCWLFPTNLWIRFLLGGVGAMILAWLCGCDRRSLGLVFRPVQGYLYWVKTGLAIGGAVMGFSILVATAVHVLGYSYAMPILSPNETLSYALSACVKAPLLEEVLYRLILCVPFVVLAGPRLTIVGGGIVFAALHFVYGNPGPDNFIAGFFLCWAYLKSGTLLVPMIFHSVGNGFVLLYI